MTGGIVEGELEGRAARRARPSRAGTRDTRHDISYVKLTEGGMVYTRAVCTCKTWESPAYWDALRAKYDAEDHLRGIQTGRKGKK